MTFSGCNSPRFLGVKMNASTSLVVGKERMSDDLTYNYKKAK